ncbi:MULTISPECIES: WXG100-like domain-containing protein [Saccharothrix]|uniref:WXG100-like domain-containing protein n=1 Tax=Saccharothrix TaxID=2071 RepID=UPI000938D3E5|nr:hypothetical protein [Saccharothrix sp. CB00851]OKI21590.1 hypothetical protein A6A25_09905 [Saccharothrix sp. CB00851]
MPIAEPTSALGLWPRVRAVTGWPETDEDAVDKLAAEWGSAGGEFADVRLFDLAAVGATWQDPAGGAFSERVRRHLELTGRIGQGMFSVAELAAGFAAEVIGAKLGIVRVIEGGLAAFGMLALLPPGVGELAQQAFVDGVAEMVLGILQGAAGRISGLLDSAALPDQEPGMADRLSAAASVSGDLLASLGAAVMNRPELVLAAAGGAALTAVSSVGVLAGGAATATGAGAVLGVPLAGLSYAGMATGAAIAGLSIAAIAHEAAMNPVDSSGSTPSRSIERPTSLEGATPEQVRETIPDTWEERPAKKGDGTRFLNPDRPGESIIIENGWPGHADPVHRGPYVKISKDGQVTRIPLEGNPALE